MSRYYSELIRNLEPYVPGEQPRDRKYIKLNTNENPYPPSPLVLQAIREATNSDLRLYPDPLCTELHQVIAGYYGLKPDQVFTGNGSDELLALAFMAFFNPGETILFPDITYSFYPVYADLFRLSYECVPLKDDFSLSVDGFLRKNGGIIIANPNAPTGIFLPVREIVKILEHNPDRVVIVDEAYVDFGGESVARFIPDFPNLLVTYTLSKSRSLAGLRIGYALGDAALITGLARVKNSFNSYTMDRLALAGGVAAFKDDTYFQETRRKVMATRDRTAARLREMGFIATDSRSNFLFVSRPGVKGETLFLKLREQGILVRHFKKPRIEDFLRVSIGTDEEMESLISALKTP